MSAIILHFWLACWLGTVYVFAVSTLTALVRTKQPGEYAGRHRVGEERTPYIDRFRAWLDAQPPVEPEVYEPAWNGPTLSQFLPDDEDAPRITYGRGDRHYRDLSTKKLDADAERLIRTVQFVEVTDEVYAGVPQ